jgi:hypothetical protein
MGRVKVDKSTPGPDYAKLANDIESSCKHILDELDDIEISIGLSSKYKIPRVTIRYKGEPLSETTSLVKRQIIRNGFYPIDIVYRKGIITIEFEK